MAKIKMSNGSLGLPIHYSDRQGLMQATQAHSANLEPMVGESREDFETRLQAAHESHLAMVKAMTTGETLS